MAVDLAHAAVPAVAPGQAQAGQWIVQLNGLNGAAGKQVRNANALLAGSELKATKHLGADGLFLVESPKTKKLDDVKQVLKNVRGFKFAEPDYTLSINAIPGDTYFGYEWGLNNTGQTGGTGDVDIDAPEAWDLHAGNSTNPVVTAVIDSGVDWSHPDLAANMWKNTAESGGAAGVDDDGNGYVDDVYGYDFYNNDANPTDENGHGTHVSGTISAAANNGQGVAGVNYNGKIMALRFLGPDGTGPTSGALAAINYAVKMKQQFGVNVRVLNNSWGGGGYSQALFDAISASNNAGQIFIAAAGNGGADQIGDNNDLMPSYPADYNIPNVVSVAATDKFDQLGTFSNFGAASVDLAAPGVDIASTYPGGQYVYMSGTSMATPHVSGAASLAFSYRPDATVAQVRSALLSSGDSLASLAGRTVTGRRLNLLGTLNALPAAPVEVVPTPTPTPTPATGDGLLATYFDNKDFTGKSASRVDAAVNFNWAKGAPVSGFGSDSFSVRWTGYVVPQYSQTYTFYTSADDGVRLWVNGKLLIDRWSSSKAAEYSGSIALGAGQAYAIKMEYYENTGNASAKLSWASGSQAKQVIPQGRLYSAAPTTATLTSVFSDAPVQASAQATDLLKDASELV